MRSGSRYRDTPPRLSILGLKSNGALPLPNTFNDKANQRSVGAKVKQVPFTEGDIDPLVQKALIHTMTIVDGNVI